MHRPNVPAPDAILRFEGTFDGVAARRVEVALARAEAGDRLLVDLTEVRDFHDFGIAVLGRALTRTRAEVKLRGLRSHQLRVLRYFGVDAEAAERAVIPDGI
jgi:anti-anti-sigma regulatory factor